MRRGKNDREKGHAVEAREQMSHAMIEYIFRLCCDMDIKL